MLKNYLSPHYFPITHSSTVRFSLEKFTPIFQMRHVETVTFYHKDSVFFAYYEKFCIFV